MRVSRSRRKGTNNGAGAKRIVVRMNQFDVRIRRTVKIACQSIHYCKLHLSIMVTYLHHICF